MNIEQLERRERLPVKQIEPQVLPPRDYIDAEFEELDAEKLADVRRKIGLMTPYYFDFPARDAPKEQPEEEESWLGILFGFILSLLLDEEDAKKVDRYELSK